MINTTFNVSYNTKERETLYHAYCEIKNRLESIRDQMDGDITDEEWDRLDREAESIAEQKVNAWYKCFAAQFRVVKNQWFAGVVEQFADGAFHGISEKQYYAFKRYAGQNDEETWKTGSTYCRCNGYFVTLTWKNACRGIKVESIS